MNMFSNKFEKRSHAFALDFVFYNFAAIRRPLGATPSRAPGGRLENGGRAWIDPGGGR
jgi:hypothetical protein